MYGFPAFEIDTDTSADLGLPTDRTGLSPARGFRLGYEIGRDYSSDRFFFNGGIGVEQIPSEESGGEWFYRASQGVGVRIDSSLYLYLAAGLGYGHQDLDNVEYESVEYWSLDLNLSVFWRDRDEAGEVQ